MWYHTCRDDARAVSEDFTSWSIGSRQGEWGWHGLLKPCTCLPTRLLLNPSNPFKQVHSLLTKHLDMCQWGPFSYHHIAFLSWKVLREDVLEFKFYACLLLVVWSEQLSSSLSLLFRHKKESEEDLRVSLRRKWTACVALLGLPSIRVITRSAVTLCRWECCHSLYLEVSAAMIYGRECHHPVWRGMPDALCRSSVTQHSVEQDDFMPLWCLYNPVFHIKLLITEKWKIKILRIYV